MFRAQTTPGGAGDIQSAISVMKQRLGKPQPYGTKRRFPGQGGPQGIDPSQVTTQGGQQGITGRGGNFQPLGAAAQGRLPQPPQAMPSAPMGGDTPEMTDFMAKNPGLTPDFIRNAAAQNGGGMAATGQVGGVAPGVGKNYVGMPQFADKVGRAAQPMQSQQAPMGGQSPMDAALAGSNITLGKMAGFGPAVQGGVAGGGGFLTPDQMETAQMGGQSAGLPGAGVPGPGGAQGMAPGLPPQVLQRLQAMRAGRGGAASPYSSLISGALGGVAGA
jgi:hypothetical protein